LKGWPHFYAILGLGAAAICLAASKVHDVLWWEWLMLPVGFLVANFVEWLVHKGPMHHPAKGAFILYQKHTLEHHVYFTHEKMAAKSPDEFDRVLFNGVSLVFFHAGIGLPLALLIRLVLGSNAAWLFWALTVSYYVLYECFHLAYHWPPAERIPGIAAMRGHHQRHHDPKLMAHCNFNVTFPIFDKLMGTCR
jgi:hypothetical protein